MAAPVESVTSKMEVEAGPFPGYPDTESFVKYALGKVIATTKSSTGLPQSGDEHDFYRSYPGFRSFCETQGDRLLHCMSRIMQYHGCHSYTGERNKHSALEDKMDLLVDANDAILERVSMMLDEASGVHRSQEPILPAGLQAPKTIISSWNRESFDSNNNYKTQTFRLLQAKNILRPQMKFKEKIYNTNCPFVPKIFIKPNAQKPLPEKMLETAELGETAHKKPGSTVPESVHTYIGDGLVQPEALNKKAIQIINRVRDKLTGRDFLNEETLDVATQVELLIKQATSHENLCQCYIGWCCCFLKCLKMCHQRWRGVIDFYPDQTATSSC